MKKIGNAEKLMMQMADLVMPKLRDDEFTTEQYIEKSKKLGLYTTYDSSRGELKKLVKNGELKIRKIKLNGKQCNAYSDATGKA
jgi:hypothetical protein